MKRRKSLLVSDEVQHSLLLRVTLHWVLFLLANFVALGIWVCCIEAPLSPRDEQIGAFLRLAIPLLICSLAIVPVFLYDITKLSNQFAGPIRRIRRGLTDYLDNGKVEPINLRRSDFWQVLADDFNRVIARSTGRTSEATDGTNVKSSYPEA